MKVILLGLLFCDASLKRTLQMTKCGVQYAPHKFQSNLINGFLQLEDVDLHVINVPPTGSFPMNSKELYAPQYRWGKGYKQISFLNLPIFKHWQQQRKLYKECCSCIRSTKEQVHILIYSPYGPFLKVCEALKKKYPNVKCSMILTDPIPGRGDLARFMTKDAVEKGNKIVRKAQCMDSFVVLTEGLAETVETNGRPYTIVECVCDDGQMPSAISTGKEKIVLYAGALEEEYGILDVAKAFAELPDAQFWIYGRGNAEKELKALAQTYPNIRFFGFVPQETVAKARDACDFLINPRRPTGTFTRYSFPSKTVEYMAAAKPVIMYKLEGVPGEYDAYLNYLSATEPAGIALQLKEIFESDYEALQKKAEAGRLFVMTQKSGAGQAKKIYTLFQQHKS